MINKLKWFSKPRLFGYCLSLICILFYYWCYLKPVELSPTRINNEQETKRQLELLKILETRDAGIHSKLDTNTTIIQPFASALLTLEIVQPLLTILIVTTPENIERRNVIRSTWKKWTNNSSEVFVYFFVGLSGDKALDERVRIEAILYNDIIIEDTLEDYQRLVIKSLRLLKWFDRNSQNSKFLIKVDDDVFVNIPRLISHIEQNLQVGTEPLIGGYKVSNQPNPDREPTSKWYVPYSWYPDQYYPTYLSGPFYITSRPTVGQLINASLQVPLIPIEDTYITGIVAKLARILPTNILGISLKRTSSIFLTHERYMLWNEYLFGNNFVWHPVKSDTLFYELYDIIINKS